MVLDSVILPGVDPADVMRKSMIFSVGMAVSPFIIFSLSEMMSGQFSGFRFQPLNTTELIVIVVALFSFIGFLPVCLWIQEIGIAKIGDYLGRNGQILERQLLGALARVYKSSQTTKMIILVIPTVVGLVDLAITRSKVGLIVYLLGQALMVYNLPWPARCELWTEIRRREILR